MTKNNSVHQMVEVLKRIGPMTENEIHQTAFGYDRNNSFGSNKKYADMLRRGMRKGLIRRVEMAHDGVNLTRINTKPTRSRFIYYATRIPEVECSMELDNEWANESI
jgi:hypothetical protein